MRCLHTNSSGQPEKRQGFGTRRRLDGRHRPRSAVHLSRSGSLAMFARTAPRLVVGQLPIKRRGARPRPRSAHTPQKEAANRGCANRGCLSDLLLLFIQSVQECLQSGRQLHFYCVERAEIVRDLPQDDVLQLHVVWPPTIICHCRSLLPKGPQIVKSRARSFVPE